MSSIPTAGGVHVSAVWFVLDANPRLGYVNDTFSVNGVIIANASGHGLTRTHTRFVYAGPRSLDIPLIGSFLSVLPAVGLFGGLLFSTAGAFDATFVANFRRAIKSRGDCIGYAEGGSASVAASGVDNVRYFTGDRDDFVMS